MRCITKYDILLPKTPSLLQPYLRGVFSVSHTHTGRVYIVSVTLATFQVSFVVDFVIVETVQLFINSPLAIRWLRKWACLIRLHLPSTRLQIEFSFVNQACKYEISISLLEIKRVKAAPLDYVTPWIVGPLNLEFRLSEIVGGILERVWIVPSWFN